MSTTVKKHLAQAIEAQDKVITQGLTDKTPVVVIPNDFNSLNLEKFHPNRLRMRGILNTHNIEAFLTYVIDKKQSGTTCFVDSQDMKATAVIDLGTEEAPLHCEQSASINLNKTASFKALIRIDRERQSQKDAAEWVEEWGEFLTIIDPNGEEMSAAKAVAGIRRIKITATREQETEVGDTSASASAMERMDANAENTLPALIQFTCEPYTGLNTRTFDLRVSVLTGERPKVIFRIVKLEQHEEEMTEEFAELLSKTFTAEEIKTYIGNFTSK